MNDLFFRLLVESGALGWAPRRGFPFQVDASAVHAARHLERLAHFYAKRVVQILRKNGEGASPLRSGGGPAYSGLALMPLRAEDERLTTAVGLQLWGEFHIETSLLVRGQAASTLEANLFVVTDLYPRVEPNLTVDEGLQVLSALGWGEQPNGVHSLGTIEEALELGISAGSWPEESKAHWSRFLFHHSLRQETEPTAGPDGQ